MLTCYVLNASQTYLTFCSSSGFELVQSSNPVEICIICACMKLMDTNSNQLHNRESLTWRQGTLAFTTTTPTPPSPTSHPTSSHSHPTWDTTRLISIQIYPISKSKFQVIQPIRKSLQDNLLVVTYFSHFNFRTSVRLYHHITILSSSPPCHHYEIPILRSGHHYSDAYHASGHHHEYEHHSGTARVIFHI